MALHQLSTHNNNNNNNNNFNGRTSNVCGTHRAALDTKGVLANHLGKDSIFAHC